MGYSAEEGDCCKSEGRMMWVCRIDAWKATFVTSPTEKEKIGGHDRKL